MTTISINGRNIAGGIITGGNICISNGCVIVDGKDIELGDSKVFNIEIIGDVGSLTADVVNKIVITGNTGDVKTVLGDIKCGDVSGSVKTISGDIGCGVISGNASTVSGDIK